jgi:hypothetical protein
VYNSVGLVYSQCATIATSYLENIFITPKRNPISHPPVWVTLLPQAAEASDGDLIVQGACVHSHSKHLTLALRKRECSGLAITRTRNWAGAFNFPCPLTIPFEK